MGYVQKEKEKRAPEQLAQHRFLGLSPRRALWGAGSALESVLLTAGAESLVPRAIREGTQLLSQRRAPRHPGGGCFPKPLWAPVLFLLQGLTGGWGGLVGGGCFLRPAIVATPTQFF